MSIKFRPVQTNISDMTTDEIKSWLRGLPDSEVIRSILVAEVKAVQSGEPRERRTMRSLWYDLVKPVLSRAGLLNKKTSGNKPVRWDGKLSDYLAELVRAGYTDYEELMIVDGSRQRQPARNITYSVASKVQMVGAHFPWVILFTEKDTIWGELQGLADLYGVSAISGSGMPSYACTENTIRAIVRSETYQKEQPKEIDLLALTDYDPAGFKIYESQFNQIIDAANGMDGAELGNLDTVRKIRIGISPNQLTPDEREANAYEPKGNMPEWVRNTGGVDGKPLGIELDALPLSRLRRMFSEAIEQSVDIEKRRQDIRESYIDLMACELLLEGFEEKREAMIKAVRSSGCWEKIQGADIPDGLFLDNAIGGVSWVGPSPN